MYVTQTIILLSSIYTQQTEFIPMHTSLTFNEPVQAVFDGATDDVVYVVEKEGVVRRVTLQKNEVNQPVFLDIRDRCAVSHSEEGLLSLVFHPEYETTPEFFVWYTATNPRRCVLSRFTTNTDTNTADTKSEKIILEVNQPWGNHNGGTVLFGKDGFLYVGVGDGGASNDPHKNGQNKKTILGSILRIDPNTDSETPYIIPKDNPFVGDETARGELWAIGLRNPWRMSFDKETGQLWVGDVGQNKWEEIDIVQKGKNYGWNIREGAHSFMSNKTKEETTPPVFEYGRRSGGSITGGYVYRGIDIPHLVGKYIYSDYLSRRTWALTIETNDGDSPTTKKIAKGTPLSISSFGETPSGELIVCGFETPYARTGKIYTLVPLPISAKE
jgi:glucose/arabinose dehydrogenase